MGIYFITYSNNTIRETIRIIEILKYWSIVEMVPILTATLSIVSSIIPAVIAKKLNCYSDELEFILRLHRAVSDILQYYILI